MASAACLVIELPLIDLNVGPGEEVEPCLPGLLRPPGDHCSLDKLRLVDGVGEVTLWPARQVNLPL